MTHPLLSPVGMAVAPDALLAASASERSRMSAVPRPGAIPRRIVAALIDMALAGVGAFGGGLASGFLLAVAGEPPGDRPSLAFIFVLFVAWLYFVRDPARHGGTAGMRLLRLRLVDVDTLGPVSTRQTFVRFMLCAFLTPLAALGMFLAVFDRRHRAWHDRVAKTAVITR